MIFYDNLNNPLKQEIYSYLPYSFKYVHEHLSHHRCGKCGTAGAEAPIRPYAEKWQPPSIPSLHLHHLKHIIAQLFVVNDSNYTGTQEMKDKIIFVNAIKRAFKINDSNKVQGSKQYETLGK